MFTRFYIHWLCAAILAVSMAGCSAPQPKEQPQRIKKISIPVNNPAGLYRPYGVWDNYRYEIRRENSLLLEHLAVCSDTVHLRYWNDRGQTVDIWSKDMKSFQGVVTSFADTVDADMNYVNPFRTFYTRHKIDTATSRLIYTAINSMGSIPSYTLVKNWQQGFDGITFSFESSAPDKYSVRFYWCPAAQNEQVKEARQVLTVINTIDSTLDLRSKFAVLYDTLQPGHYSIGSPAGALHKASKEEMAQQHLYPDEARAYMLSRQHNVWDYKL